MESLCTITNVLYIGPSGDRFSCFAIFGLPEPLTIPIVVDAPRKTIGTLYDTGARWVFEPNEEQEEDTCVGGIG